MSATNQSQKTPQTMKIKIALLALAVVMIIAWTRQNLDVTPSMALVDNNPVTEEATVVSNPTDLAPMEIPAKAQVFPGPQLSSEERALQLVRAIEEALNFTNAVDREAALTNLLPAFVACDPAAAGRWVQTREPGAERMDLLRRVALAWSAKDLTNAVAWGVNLPDYGEQFIALSESCYQLAQTDPAAAVAMVEQNDLSAYNSNLENMAQLWANKDLPATLDWAIKQPEGYQRDNVLARIASVQAQTDPAGAANLVAGQMTPGSAQTEAAISVLHQWAQRDLAGATAWGNQFPEGPLRDQAQAEITGIAQQIKAAQSSP